MTIGNLVALVALYSGMALLFGVWVLAVAVLLPLVTAGIAVACSIIDKLRGNENE